jgi:hypothetical protein
LIRQEVETPPELARLFGNLVGKVNGLLVGDQLFKCECHGLLPFGWVVADGLDWQQGID